jgi:hypothetical protein
MAAYYPHAPDHVAHMQGRQLTSSRPSSTNVSELMPVFGRKSIQNGVYVLRCRSGQCQ